jgi:hypothetical protein
MATLRGVVVLPAAGTFTQVTIDTNIATDSTSGWEITGFRAVLKSRDASGVEVLESNDIDCILATRATTITTPDETEEIARVCWALGFGTAVGATSIEEQKTAPMLETRLTVQPNIYVGVFCSTTIGSITDIYYEISYVTTKLNNNELLRLLIGGV